jgi:hypothetical protein
MTGSIFPGNLRLSGLAWEIPVHHIGSVTLGLGACAR